MSVVVWIVEGAWPACVGAASAHAPADSGVVLLHVAPADVHGAAHGAFAGLLGRGHPERDPGTRLERLAATSARSCRYGPSRCRACPPRRPIPDG